MKDVKFGGIDPIILLNKKYGANLSSIRGLNPILNSLDLASAARPQMLDFSMKMQLPMNMPTRLVLVGCGGTGSHFLPNILQYLWSRWQSKGTPLPEIILIDADRVEAKNLVRQRFTSADLEMNKAAALAQRYSSVFGFKISVLEGYLTKAEELHAVAPCDRFNIIVGAVDNHRARMIIWDYVNSGNWHQRYGTAWIDAGNESWHGQAILGLKVMGTAGGMPWNTAKLGEAIKCNDTPNFFDEYPSEFLRIGGTPPVPQNNCAAMVDADPQTIQANMMSAFCATSLAIQVCSGIVSTTQLNFDAQSGNTKARFLTKANIAEDQMKIDWSHTQIRNLLRGLTPRLDLEGNLITVEPPFPWLEAVVVDE